MIRLPAPRYILPNLFTLASAFCGVAIIWLSSEAQTAGDFFFAAALIPIACFLDGFDGRVARMVHGESKIGMQLDSMSDLITFGVAPAFLMYHWALEGLGFAGIVLAFIFAAAAMIRLARFNVEADEVGGASRYFNGLPAPMAGGAISALVSTQTGVLGRSAMPEELIGTHIAFLVIFALLMVSNVPFRTLKDTRMTVRNRLVIATGLGALTALAIRFDVMFALSVGLFGYLGANLLGSLLRIRRAVRVAAGGAVVLDDEDDDFDEFEGFDDDE